MTYGETGPWWADSALAETKAHDSLVYIEGSGGLDAPSEAAPCMRELEEAITPGQDAGAFLSETLPAGTGTSQWKGENAGCYGLAKRQCGRIGCSRVCGVVVANGGELLETHLRSFDQDCLKPQP